MNQNSRPQVFLSHVHEDAEFAKMIRAWIESSLLEAVDFFINTDSESLLIGEDWLRRVREALEHSNIMLVIVSPVSIQRPWIHFETGAGYVRDIPVIPLCIDGVKLDSLDLPLRLLQGLELPAKESETRLISRIAEAAGLRPPKDLDELPLLERIKSPTDFSVLSFSQFVCPLKAAEQHFLQVLLTEIHSAKNGVRCVPCGAL